MRITILLTVLSLFNIQASTYSQPEKISLNMKDVSVQDVLMEIENTTEFKFLFNRSHIDVGRKISIEINKKRVEVILKELFKGTSVEFEIYNRQIILKKATALAEPQGHTEGMANAPPQLIIEGTITDMNQVPLGGANVMEKGTSNGVVADFDGNFAIEVSGTDAVLSFSFIGFETKDVQVGQSTEINVQLAESAQGLEEVVVVGYGTQKKKNLTGAVQSLSLDEAVNVPVANSSQLMYGRFSGVQITQGGGMPGSDASSINIRGIGTFGNSSPLIVIDGMQYDGLKEFNQLAPSDIEDITVLKDASAGAIYGARGANGVIVVTTKKGKEGDLKVELNTYSGIQSPTVVPRLLKPVPYARLVNENLINGAGGNVDAARFSEEDIALIRNGSDRDRFAQTDWTEEILRDAPILNGYLSFSGGNKKTTYKVSLGYLKQDAIIKGKFNYERYNLQANINSKLNDWLSISNNFLGSMDKERGPAASTGQILNRSIMESPNNASAGEILTRSQLPPTIPLRYSNGEYGVVDGSYYSSSPIVIQENPIRLGELGDYKREFYNFNDRFSVKIEPLPGLSFETSASVSLYFEDISNHTPRSDRQDWDGNIIWESGNNSLLNLFNKRAILLNDNLLKYEKTLGEDHFLSILAGHSIRYVNNDGFRASLEGFPSESLQELDAGGVLNPAVGGARAEDILQSLFGRINYSYKDRYLVEINFRRDGSSKFGPENRYGNFPSFSAGWRISEEPFFKALIPESTLNYLKLRGSWGRTGNNGIGNYIYDQTYGTGLDYVLGSGSIVSAVALTRLANSDIRWETTEQLDLGIDASFFQGKLNFVGDYFKRESFDVLYTNFPIPSTIGVNSIAAKNSAEILNEGIELNLDYTHRGKFTYTIGANLTKMFPNKVTSLGSGVATIGANDIIMEGEPYRAYYGYRQIGIFQTSEEVENSPEQFGDASVGPGDLKYADISGPEGVPDGIVDDLDRTVIGNPYPEFQYGLFANFTYSGIDFGMSFQGVQNVDRILKNGANLGFGNEQSNVLAKWENRWTPENTDTNLHRLGGSRNNVQKLSTFYIQDASFLRLKNIEIGYSFPDEFLKKIHLKKLRVFVSGQNLLTFTKMEDFDPERLSNNIGSNSVPIYKSITSGINITF